MKDRIAKIVREWAKSDRDIETMIDELALLFEEPSHAEISSAAAIIDPICEACFYDGAKWALAWRKK
jgi:hypothetical protein